MARAMASLLRVKNTAYFDIAAYPLHQRTLGSRIARSLKAMRPTLDGQASKANGQICCNVPDLQPCLDDQQMGRLSPEVWPGDRRPLAVSFLEVSGDPRFRNLRRHAV